jgi:hypothetical protein
MGDVKSFPLAKILGDEGGGVNCKVSTGKSEGVSPGKPLLIGFSGPSMMKYFRDRRTLGLLLFK